MRFGSATYLGDLSDRNQLELAGSFFGPGTDKADHRAGTALMADAANKHHDLTHYANSLHVVLDAASSGGYPTTTKVFEVQAAISRDKAPIYGGIGDDRLFGTTAGNAMRGGAGDDDLFSRTGDDRLFGNAGADTLVGGLGRDVHTGGAGADTFIFKSKADSTVSSGGRDKIFDFTRAEHDHIDLHLMDASTKASGNQAFKFIGTKAFTKHAGELQAKKVGSDTLISGDINGDGKADFALLLDTALTMQKGDFIL